LLVAAEMSLLLRMRPPRDLARAALDHAWRLLAPSIPADGLTANDAAFFAGLARESVGRGDTCAREPTLPRLVESVSTAGRRGRAALAAVVPLVRLQVADAAVTGGDPARLLADAVGPCFQGERPLRWADRLLTDDALADWTRGQLARLRVLLAARAFGAGLGVW